MADDFSRRVYASIVDDASVTGERNAEAFMMLSVRRSQRSPSTQTLGVTTSSSIPCLGGWEPKVVLSQRTLTGPRTRRILCIYSE
jgi:hypothetical protein